MTLINKIIKFTEAVKEQETAHESLTVIEKNDCLCVTLWYEGVVVSHSITLDELLFSKVSPEFLAEEIVDKLKRASFNKEGEVEKE
jgi:hypothetical protein